MIIKALQSIKDLLASNSNKTPGMKLEIRYCPHCRTTTAQQKEPGGWFVCGTCSQYTEGPYAR